MDDAKNLHDIFNTLKKRAGMIGLLTILAIVVSGVVSFFLVTPSYETTTQILVSRSQSESTELANEDVQTDLQLISTYSDIIKSPAILEQVKIKLGLPYSVAELNQKITVSASENSQVLNISATDEEPGTAVRIANTTAEVLIAEIPKLMNVENVSLLYAAVLNENASPLKPDILLNLAIAAAIGLMIGVSAAFLFEYLDTTIKNGQDIKASLGVPVLALISPISEQEKAADWPSIKREEV
ncbi:YveK family protein [Planococcus shenhongbingii]|uniref:Wzz/FepE/Etk N-terminal domain-containing protein n=1 Tax=Planococcus shenhongbingii TaxID=3058398 RepID=A0ABT8N9L2_9BACL|nr:Wzz/FepE/Etk N-terminal domain-containing protein [Planococcus sp. N017]MDN7244587.1 Wzz/FepE/Etk N-terminal domain-containing protein [Planococcus sp. N017]